MIPEDELRGLGAVPHLNTELSLAVNCHVITTLDCDWLTHHAAEVHGGALLDIDVGAAEDLGDGLGDGEGQDVAHDRGAGDLTLVQPRVRLL